VNFKRDSQAFGYRLGERPATCTAQQTCPAAKALPVFSVNRLQRLPVDQRCREGITKAARHLIGAGVERTVGST
jgi:hypothetical protein